MAEARAAATLLAAAALGACATVAPPRSPEELLGQLHDALVEFRHSAASTARLPPQPPLALLLGVPRERLAGALGTPDGCPDRPGAACAWAQQWRFRFFAPPPIHDEMGSAVASFGYTIDLAVGFGGDGTVSAAAWQLGR